MAELPAKSQVELSLLGARMHALAIAELGAILADAVRQRKRCVIAHQNLHGAYLLQRSQALRALHEQADWIHIDGMPLIFWARLLGYKVDRTQRVTYVDWTPALLSQAHERHWRIYFLGSKPGVFERAAEHIRRQYPSLTLAGEHGHFDASSGSAASAAVLKRIREFGPDVLMVGMGMPRQEQWILENLEALPRCVILPCGAAMDYVAGEVSTPPRWMGRAGLEWLWRLAGNPRRLASRYLVEPWFLLGPMVGDVLRRVFRR